MSLKTLFAALAVAAASSGCVVTTGVIIPDRHYGHGPVYGPVYRPPVYRPAPVYRDPYDNRQHRHRPAPRHRHGPHNHW